MAKSIYYDYFFIFDVIKLKFNDINLSIYAVEIVFETRIHSNGRNMTYEKEFHH